MNIPFNVMETIKTDMAKAGVSDFDYRPVGDGWLEGRGMRTLMVNYGRVSSYYIFNDSRIIDVQVD